MTVCPICKGTRYIIENDVARRCECFEEVTADAFYQAALAQSGLPNVPKFTIEQYKGTKSVGNLVKLTRFVSYFSDRYFYQSLYWFGDNSTQKTTMACWVADQLMQHKKTVKYIKMRDLLKLVMDADFANGESLVSAELNRYLSAHLLIIDESFDRDKVTIYKSNYQISFLDNFLRSRLEGMNLSTIFISNAPLESIEENFGRSLQELIRRNTTGAVFTWEDKFSPDTEIINNLWEWEPGNE